MGSENRQKQAVRRKTPSSVWKPGQSGNPGGRPKVAAEIQAVARDHGREAIERLVALMGSKNESVAVRAAEALLDRGYGRPVQELSGQEAAPKQTAIRVTFVEPPKRDEHGSIPRRPSVIGYSEAK